LAVEVLEYDGDYGPPTHDGAPGFSNTYRVPWFGETVTIFDIVCK
jgi:hypothetical protein